MTDIDCVCLCAVEVNPRTLQEMSRSLIRNILRSNIAKEYPDLNKRTHSPAKKIPKNKRAMRRLVVPLFDTSEESSDDEFRVRSRHIPRRRGEREEDIDDNASSAQVREMMLNYVLDRIRDRRNQVLAQRQINNGQLLNVLQINEADENAGASGDSEAGANGNAEEASTSNEVIINIIFKYVSPQA